MAKYKPGECGNPAGRKKGSKNVIPRTLAEGVMAAFKKLQETPGKSLVDLALDDHKWFYAVLVRPMLPKELTISTDGEGLTVTLNLNREKPCPKPKS